MGENLKITPGIKNSLKRALRPVVGPVDDKAVLPILVIDDRQENRDAAKEFFGTVNDVKVDFAETYEEAKKKLSEKVYCVAFIDLELPMIREEKPEKLGFELAKEIDEALNIRWVVITSGIDHHNCKAAFVSYWWEGIIDPNEKLIREITETPKTDPRSWGTAFIEITEHLEGPLPLLNLHEIISDERETLFWKWVANHQIPKLNK